MSSDQSKLVKRLYTYKKKWEFEPELKDWIQEVEGISHQVYCRYCKNLLHPRRKELLAHANTKKHKLNFERGLYLREKVELEFEQEIGATCSSTVDADYSSELRIKTELKFACLMVEVGDNIRDLDYLETIFSSAEYCGPGLKNISLHPSRLTALIVNVVAPVLHKKLLYNIDDSYYSLIIDDNTSMLTQKYLTVVIKYHSKSLRKIVTTFYKIIPIDKVDVYSLTNILCDALAEDGLDLQKCIGIGVDGVSAMIEPQNSVYGLLKEKVPHIQFIKCVCHSLNLAGGRASEEVPSQVEFLVREIFTWFSHSSSRMNVFRKIFNTLNSEYLLEMLQPAETRWLSRGECIAEVVGQWDKVKRHFYCAKEYCHTAEILFNLMNDPVNKLYLIFLKPIIHELNTINNLFQDDISSIAEPLNELIRFYKSILEKLVIPSHFAEINNVTKLISFRFQDHLIDTFVMTFEYDFQIECQNVDSNEVQNVKDNCRLFMIKMATELHHLLPSNMKILENLDMLHPDKALHFSPPPIIPLAAEFKVICKEILSTELEWNNLIFGEWMEREDESLFWLEVSDNCNSEWQQLYPHISDLALALLCLPVSNGTVERIFKTVNEMKCKIRNRWQLNTANSFLQVKLNLQRIDEHCTTFQPPIEMIVMVHEEMYQISEDALLD